LPIRKQTKFLGMYLISLICALCIGGVTVYWWWQLLDSAIGTLLTLVGLMAGFLLSIFIMNELTGENNKYRSIVATTRNAVITTDYYGSITEFNRIAEEMFHIDRQLVLGRHYEKVFSGRVSKHTVGFHVSLDNALKQGEVNCNQEMLYTAPDGWEMVLTVDTLPISDSLMHGALMIARDITMRKAMEQRLYDLTMCDGLTKLYNHGHLHKTLKNEIKRCAEQKKHLALIFLDIDNFKYYNDNFGHPSGDKILQEFARLLIKSIRPEDTAFRYGGDEFGIILPGAEMGTAEQIGERLRRQICEYPFVNREKLPGGCISASIGIAMFPEHSSSVHELVKNADEAMYHAKRNVKNQLQVYFSSIEKFQEELNSSENDIMATMKTLLTMVNGKDRYTYMHSEKVADYAAVIASELKLEPEQIKEIKLAGFLHDIGKLEVAAEILGKKGPLNDEEMENIKQHPRWGANMLRSFRRFATVLPAILHHHERYDGNGYPDGLAGEDIPVFARIITIADSFDAMISHRPYKRSLTLDEAIHELEKNTGTQFDPALARVFINVLKIQREKIFSLHTDLAG